MKKATDYYRVNMEHDDKSFTVYSPYTGDLIDGSNLLYILDCSTL